MHSRFGTAVAALAISCLAVSVSAQPLPGLSSRQTGVIFYTENDDWPPDTGTDKNYTNGFRLTLDRNSDPIKLHRLRLFRWVPDYPSCHETEGQTTTCISTAFHFGQQFYTPDDISIPDLIPNDRPYAAWLYVGGTWRAANIRKAAITDVYLGFTGDWSLGRQVQTGWHRIVSATKPEGWDHQIGRRLGVVVAHSRHWAPQRLEKISNHNRWFEMTPFVGGNAGNIMTDGYAGGRAKIGWNITRDWTHSTIGPVAARQDDARPGRFEVFLSVDARGRLVAYNVFLDAAKDHDLSRRIAVGDVGVAIGLRVGSFMATYRVAKYSREYDEALTHHEFKALRFMYVIR